MGISETGRGGEAIAEDLKAALAHGREGAVAETTDRAGLPPDAGLALSVPMRIHIIPQSHIDLVWFWPEAEGIRMILATFRGHVEKLEADPELTYAQGQFYAYDVIRREDPTLFGRIQRLVAEGRWEPVGGEVRTRQARRIAERAAWNAERGVPVVVFNPLGHRVSTAIEARVTLPPEFLDLVPCAVAAARTHTLDCREVPAAAPGLEAVGPDGSAAPVMIAGYAQHQCRHVGHVRFRAHAVPPFGYATFYLRRGAAPEPRVQREGWTFRTPRLTVCFDPGRGGIRALAVNDVPPVEIAAGEHPLGELGLYETGRYPMDYGEELRAWHAAFTGARRFLEPAEQAVRSFSGERRAVSFHYRFGHSAVTQEFLIEPDAEFVEATVSGEWGEVEQYLKIHFVLPAAEEVVAFADLPYGFTERLPEKQEYSMQYLCGMRDARRGLVVVNNGRYGCLWDGARLSLSVIRCATYPAGRSDQGPFAVRYRVGLADVTAPDWRLRAFRAGYELDVPPCSYAPEYTRADRPAMWSPLDEPLDGVLGTCLKPAHSGPAAVLRLFNPAPASRTQRVVFRDDVKLTAVDLLEEPCEQDVREADRAAEFALRPFGLATLRVSPRTPADSCWSARAAPSSGAA